MKLSDNFWLSEFTQSQTATRMGRTISPTNNEITQLRNLCQQLLQPIRDHLTANIDSGIRMHISSGLRPVWLNKAIGGSKTSDHVFGRAADWGISGAPEDYGLYETCLDIASLDLPFDQLIFEGNRWIHTSWRSNPRKQILTATFHRTAMGRRKTTYHRGLQRVA